MSERIDIPVPQPVTDLAALVADAGHAVVLVGGCVRDAVLGVPNADLDLATDAPTSLLRTLAEKTSGIRSIYAVGERFGTIGLALDDGSTLELTCFRGDTPPDASPAEKFAADAMLRDLTVNAIGVWLPGGEVADPVGGVEDLRVCVLRAPGDPAARLAEDPLRVLRVARFASQLGFAVEPATAVALPDAAPGLARVAVERVRDELTKLLLGDGSVAGLRIARDSGALAVVLPEVSALAGLEQPTFHDLDAFEHTAQCVSLAPRTRVMRWAALLHDVGKAPAKTIEPDGRIRFFGHAHSGADLARAACERLRFSIDDTKAIVHLVATHMRLGELDPANERAVDRAVRALDLWVGTGGPGTKRLVSAEEALELMLADLGATAGRETVPHVRAELQAAIAESRERGTRVQVRSPVGGRELMQVLALEPGREIGVAKDAIVSAIEGGELAADDREGAIRVAREALGVLHSGDHNLEGADDE